MTRAHRRALARPRREREVAIPAGAAIADALAARGLTEELRGHDLVARWADIVGARIANRAWPDGLSGRVLWVRVSSTAWLHELSMLRPELTRKLREAMGPPALFDELKLHLGGRGREAGDLLPPPPPPRRPRRAPPPPVAASGPRAAAIEAETSAIADDELRELVRRVRLRNDR